MEPIPHFPSAVQIPEAVSRSLALVVGLALAFLIAYLVAWVAGRRRMRLLAISPRRGLVVWRGSGTWRFRERLAALNDVLVRAL